MPTTQLPNTASLRPDFILRVSTSSFQVEGATQEDGRGQSIWDVYCRSGEIKNHDTGDVACDHYHRCREDVGLMKALGVQADRFSIAWPRVLPLGRGLANEAGLSFHERLIDKLLTAGIEPWPCLYHWDLPQALEERGGCLNRESAVWIADYAHLIATRFGDRVKRFATFNEPSMFSLFSRSLGKRDSSGENKLYRMIHNVNLAHGAAVDVLRANVIDASIGCVHNRQPCRPSSASEAEATAAARLDVYWNAAIPDPQCRGEYPLSMRAAFVGSSRRRGGSKNSWKRSRPISSWTTTSHSRPS
jgi:beta-glucosidase